MPLPHRPGPGPGHQLRARGRTELEDLSAMSFSSFAAYGRAGLPRGKPLPREVHAELPPQVGREGFSPGGNPECTGGISILSYIALLGHGI